ncbi:MAG TPA: hypothetical protein VMD05_10245, partial [Candidatus Nanoarchaeia archaeon]|nr:hypothetical protein [Candidatus Nanoarchaeia archaeon]
AKNEKNELDAKTFEDLIIEAADEVFSFNCESAKNSFCFHLEKTFAILKEDIPNRFEKFSCALEKIFGIGAICIEIHAMKNLNLKFNVKFRLIPLRVLFKNLLLKKRVSLTQLNHKNFIKYW